MEALAAGDAWMDEKDVDMDVYMAEMGTVCLPDVATYCCEHAFMACLYI